MQTQLSLLNKLMLTVGVFSLTTLVTYGTLASTPGFMKSSPYMTRDATADTKLNTMTNGAGNTILDKVVVTIKSKAEEKGGTPLNITLYNAYIDERLSLLNTLDDEIRAEAGSDYAFLFQYIYPRVLELKKSNDQTASFLDKILSVVGREGGSGTETGTTSTSTNTTLKSTSTTNTSSSTASSTNTTQVCSGGAPSGPGVVISGYSATTFGGGSTNGTTMVNSETNPNRIGCTWSCADGYMVNKSVSGCRAVTDNDFVARRDKFLDYAENNTPITDPTEIVRLQSIKDYANKVFANGRTPEALKLLADTANRTDLNISSWEVATALGMTWEQFSRENAKAGVKYIDKNGGVGVVGESRALIPAGTSIGNTSQSVINQIKADMAGLTGKTQVELDAYLRSTTYTPEQLSAATGYTAADLASAIAKAKTTSSTATTSNNTTSSTSVETQIKADMAGLTGKTQAELDAYLSSTTYTPEQLSAATGYTAADLANAIAAAKAKTTGSTESAAPAAPAPAPAPAAQGDGHTRGTFHGVCGGAEGVDDTAFDCDAAGVCVHTCL